MTGSRCVCSARPADCDQKGACCGGALAFSEPEKSQARIKGIIEPAYDHGAEMITTPCPVCQMSVKVCQGQIKSKIRHQFQCSAGI